MPVLTFDREAIEQAADSEAPGGLGARTSLFNGLGWHTELVGTGPETAISLQWARQPELLVVGDVDPSRAVSLAYSHEADYVLSWTQSSLRLIPSRNWNAMPGDHDLITLDEGAGHRVAQVLTALGRERFGSFRSSDDGVRVAPLVERLANAFAGLRFASAEGDAGRVGEVEAFQLFHQLLFVRFHEDRFGPLESVQRIRSLDTTQIAAIDILSEIVSVYAELFNSELFEKLDLVRGLPKRAVLDVVKAMSEPWKNLNLDFEVSANDVAGRLYQSYLALTPSLENEDRLFPVAVPRNRQKSQGSFYTRAYLAEQVTTRALGSWLDERTPSEPSEVRVMDFACGSGVFLLQAYRHLLGYFMDVRGRPLTTDERVELLVQSIYGSDVDEAAVAMARVQLLEEAGIGARRLPRLAENVSVADALGQRPDHLSKADVVLSNPPFQKPGGAKKAGYDTDVLRTRYPSFRGTGANLAFAFAEEALNSVNPGGRIGMVLPQVVLDGPAASGLRSIVGRRLASATDYGHTAMFGTAMVYVATVDIAESSSLAPTAILGAATQTADTRWSGDIRYEVNVPSDQIAESESWSPFAHRLHQLMSKEVSAQLLPLSGVVAGTQTGNDPKFVLDEARWESSDEKVMLDQKFEVPRTLVPKWASGKTLSPFRIDWDGKRVVIPELGSHDTLDRFIENAGGQPKSFRRGNLETLSARKVMIRAFFYEPAAVADIDGEWMIPQGGGAAYAIGVSSKADALYYEALLNSSLYQWMLQGLAHPKAHGFNQLMKHHWGSVSVPSLDGRQRAEIRNSGNAVRKSLKSPEERALHYWKARKTLDETVFDTLGVSPHFRTIVNHELRRKA